MKKDIHPDNYRLVVFKDTSCDYSFLTKSTVETKDTVVWDDGSEYPLYNIEISNKITIGIPNPIWLIKSGGVIIADKINIITIICFLYF